MTIAYKLESFATTGLGNSFLELSFYKPPLFLGVIKWQTPASPQEKTWGAGSA